jgi:nucleotide-binding universal stress UspA family protein
MDFDTSAAVASAFLAYELATAPVHVEHIVVPLDGSEFAESALTVADYFAAPLGASISAVSVCDSALGRQQMETYYERLMLRTGRPDLTFDLPIENADPGRCIVETAQRSTNPLLCMASHGRGRVATSVLGSVARSVLLASHQPTIVGGPHCSVEPPGSARLPVVACIDGSPASATVLRTATAWAQRLHTKLAIVTVAEPAPSTISDDHRYRRGIGPEGEATSYVGDIAVAVHTATGVTTTAHAVYNPLSAADGIREFVEANPAQLIVVATHSRIGGAQLVLGSQAARIVHDAPVPVLVTPIEIDEL